MEARDCGTVGLTEIPGFILNAFECCVCRLAETVVMTLHAALAPIVLHGNSELTGQHPTSVALSEVLSTPLLVVLSVTDLTDWLSFLQQRWVMAQSWTFLLQILKGVDFYHSPSNISSVFAFVMTYWFGSLRVKKKKKTCRQTKIVCLQEKYWHQFLHYRTCEIRVRGQRPFWFSNLPLNFAPLSSGRINTSLKDAWDHLFHHGYGF